MDNTNDELNRAAEAGDLNTLPIGERKETQDILDEIVKGEGEKAEKAKADDAKKADNKPEHDDDDEGDKSKDKKPDDSKKDEGKKDENDKPGKRREVKLIPAYQLKIAEERWGKENGELKTKIEELMSGKAKGDLNKDDIKTEIEKIAEEEGMSVNTIERIVQIASKANPGKELPQDMIERLNRYDTIAAEREVEIETARFSKDFDTEVLPLIKAEYGDNVPQHVIDEIREDLKEKAYSEGFEKVPYNMLFRGDDTFRGRVGEVKRGSEPSSPGTHYKAGAGAAEVDLSKPMSDDAIKTLTPAQFETYMGNMEVLEKNKQL